MHSPFVSFYTITRLSHSFIDFTQTLLSFHSQFLVFLKIIFSICLVLCGRINHFFMLYRGYSILFLSINFNQVLWVYSKGIVNNFCFYCNSIFTVRLTRSIRTILSYFFLFKVQLGSFNCVIKVVKLSFVIIFTVLFISTVIIIVDILCAFVSMVNLLFMRLSLNLIEHQLWTSVIQCFVLPGQFPISLSLLTEGP